MSPLVPKHWPGLALLALALTAFVVVFATTSAGAAGAPERLVVRGDATAVDGPCDARACPLELTDGRFRGDPGRRRRLHRLAQARGRRAPSPTARAASAPRSTGRIVLGAGTADRLVLAVSGDSCQDGAGPLAGASFTGLARFTVKHGTGSYAGADRQRRSRASPRTPPSTTA